jgi:hypothetical protein
MSFPRAAHVARFCIAMTNRCEREFLLLWAVPLESLQNSYTPIDTAGI